MFSRVYNIINFDFAKFDTSRVTDMRCMFSDSSSMTSLDITNFNTSLVTDMRSMFNKCYSLVTLDLNNFDTSKVTDFYRMFFNCSNLISLNVNNFNLISSTNIGSMFEKCPSLISLDLTNFDSKKIMNVISNMFKDSNPNILLLINTNDTQNITYHYPNFKININSICLMDKHKIINEKKECIENCKDDNIYKYDYNGLCIIQCPSNTYYSNNNYICLNNIEEGYYVIPNSQILLKYTEKYKTCSYESIQQNLCTTCNIQNSYYPIYNKINNSFLNCFNETIEGFYLDTAFKPCYRSCKTCLKSGNKTNNNCLTCIADYSFDSNSSNCYKSELNQENLDDSTDYKNIFSSKSEIVNDTIFENRTEIIQSVIKKLFYELNISDIDNGIDKTIIEKDLVFIFTSTINQKNNEDKNNISMNLGKCEILLKNDYNISQKDSLYILEIIIGEEGMKIPKVEYEIYYPFYNNNNSNLTKIDLNVCQGTKIEISNVVKINDHIDKYNTSSGYYNNLCYKTTSESGTDITLKDRRNVFVDSNMTLCEENCELIDYNYTNEKAKCSCPVKLSKNSNNDFNFNKTIFLKNFIDIKNIANLEILRCFKTIMKINDLSNNYGFFIISIILLYFISLFVFWFISYTKLSKDLNNIYSASKKK